MVVAAAVVPVLISQKWLNLILGFFARLRPSLRRVLLTAQLKKSVLINQRCVVAKSIALSHSFAVPEGVRKKTIEN